MKKLSLMNLKRTLAVILVGGSVFIFSALSFGGKTYACNTDFNKTLLGLPTWYKYLQGEEVEQRDGSKVCQPRLTAEEGELPKKDILLVGAAILEMLIRLAGIAAFAYLIYGGFMYLTSSGNSENTKKAGATLLNAAIGLAIAISATTLVNFFANRLSQ